MTMCRSLGRVTGQLIAAVSASDCARELDAGFDAGEWSGPAHWRMLASELSDIARAAGFPSLAALVAEIERRTSPRWVHYNVTGGEPLDDDDDS